MLIDEQVRLRSLIRAMQDVIIPSIAPEAQLAAEQAQLVCAHLGLMLAQADYNFRLQLAELAHFTGLLRDLTNCETEAGIRSVQLDEAESLLTKANPIADLKVPDGGELGQLTRQVRDSADRVLQSALAAGGSVRAKASRIVVDYASRQIQRERVAVKTAGFELDAASLPDLKDVT